MHKIPHGMDLSCTESNTRIAQSVWKEVLLLGCKRIAIVLSHFVRHQPETSTTEAHAHLKKSTYP